MFKTTLENCVYFCVSLASVAKTTPNRCEVTEHWDTWAPELLEGDLKGRFFIRNIHTHPVHQNFMSSVDLHNHFLNQKSCPEYFACVYVPKDKFGTCFVTYSLTPSGMKILGECPHGNTTAFHTHEKSGIVMQAMHVTFISESETMQIVQKHQNVQIEPRVIDLRDPKHPMCHELKL